MIWNNVHRIYFIGIGGIGMSALARYFNQSGKVVSGYDKTRTPLCDQLLSEGIQIHFNEDLDALDPKADLVVYTPAIPASHAEWLWYQQHGYTILKRSEVLQKISENMKAICVAGTHGKTTVSTCISHILRHSQYGCHAFLGGISANYQTNYWSSESLTAVIEADEYDRSFLKLNPSVGVVTAMDPDHLDIYGTVEAMEQCYLEFIGKINDLLVYKHGLKHSRSFHAPQQYSYSLQNDAADFYASDIEVHQGTYRFQFNRKGEALGMLDLPIGGMHNVENTVAAATVALLLGVPFEKIQAAVAAFRGVKRRFEYVLHTADHVLIDDYAHHPEELRMLISSTRNLFRDKKISVVFQPHLYTRTRDLADGFAESLDLADEVILLPVYPARELPIEGVESEMIMERMNHQQVHVLSKEGLLKWVEAAQPHVLVMAGAGDIDALVEPVSLILQKSIA